MPCYILEHCFWQKIQNKAFRPALCAFLDKLEVFLEVVGHRPNVHAFVGLFNTAVILFLLAVISSIHNFKTRVKTSSKISSGKSCRVRLMVLCQGKGSSIS
jgi:hypothetical protein